MMGLFLMIIQPLFTFQELSHLQKLWKSPINVKKNMEGGNRMKKKAIIVLCLALVFTLIGCGNNAQSSDEHNAEYEEGYAAGYEAGYNDGKQQMTESQKHFAQFSGSFTATVEQLLPDYYALPGKTVAVVHFFQDRPFLLHFQKDLTGELIEGTAYVFEFETFEVELPDNEENPNISDYMYSINVTNYRVAEDDELGLEGKNANCRNSIEVSSQAVYNETQRWRYTLEQDSKAV